MKKRFIIVMILGVLLLSIGLSYSYFTGQVGGEEKKLEVVAKNVRILFTDDKEISSSDIKPGWSEVKSFSVKNESEAIFNYNIVFEKLVNTFVTEGYLKYKIISTDGGYTMEDYVNVPKSSSPTDFVLAYDIDIEPGKTHNYTIEFVYINDENVDQSVDMGKEFSGNLAIIEGSVDPSIKYTVTMNLDESIGEVSPASGESLKKGNLDFIVTPKNEYDISTMSVECDPVANVVVLDNNIKVNDIRQNHNCNITMSKKKYTVEIKVNDGTSNALNKIIEHGSSATATITPDYGYTLTGATVTGEGCSLNETTGELTISNVTKPGTCEVTLERDTYTVTLTGVGLNTSNSPQTAEYEGSTTLTYTLKDGYYMGESSVNCDYGTPVVNGNTITVSNVTANTTCTITPTLSSYNVTLKVNGGTVNNKAEDTISVQHGSSGTFSIAASTGYKLELNGTISCEGASGSLSGSTVTISGVTKAQTCTVNLKKQTFTVSVSAGTGGSASPASSTVTYGSDLEITITPSTGYEYSSNTCGVTPSNGKLSFTNITSAINCNVTFVRKTYTVNVSSNNTSYGTVSPISQTVEHGDSATVTITPSTGYQYSDNDCGGTVSGSTMTISNITAAKSCKVTFTVRTYTVSVSVTGGKANYSSRSVSYNGSTTFTITANAGYSTNGASVVGTGCSLSGNTLTVSNVTSSITCSVNCLYSGPVYCASNRENMKNYGFEKTCYASNCYSYAQGKSWSYYSYDFPCADGQVCYIFSCNCYGGNTC